MRSDCRCCLYYPWQRDSVVCRQEYGLAAAVTVGCALFVVSGRVASKVAAQQRHTSLFGVVLMLTYLAFDGFTSTWQVSLYVLRRSETTQPSCTSTELHLEEGCRPPSRC